MIGAMKNSDDPIFPRQRRHSGCGNSHDDTRRDVPAPPVTAREKRAARRLRNAAHAAESFAEPGASRRANRLRRSTTVEQRRLVKWRPVPVHHHHVIGKRVEQRAEARRHHALRRQCPGRRSATGLASPASRMRVDATSASCRGVSRNVAIERRVARPSTRVSPSATRDCDQRRRRTQA